VWSLRFLHTGRVWMTPGGRFSAVTFSHRDTSISNSHAQMDI
jgi:hypothetical protein